MALDGGADGMDLIRRIIGEAPSWLARGGFLLVEMDPRQMEEAEALAGRGENYRTARRHKDFTGRDRVLELQRK